MNLIVALDKNYAIGCNNTLLYHIPEDMKFFRAKTLNKVVVMGRQTLESLPNGKPLPNRVNIVLSRQQSGMQNCSSYPHTIISSCPPSGVDRQSIPLYASSISDLLKKLKSYPAEDIFIIGGKAVYTQLAPYCKYAYITHIDATTHADTFLDKDLFKDWQLIYSSDYQSHNDLRYKFTTYENLSTDKLTRFKEQPSD